MVKQVVRQASIAPPTAASLRGLRRGCRCQGLESLSTHELLLWPPLCKSSTRRGETWLSQIWYICFMPKRRSSSPSIRLASPLLRHTALVAVISLFLAILLIAYVFGFHNEFFFRTSAAFFVLFCLLAVTFLVVVPFVNWAASNWFGAGWQETPIVPTRRSRPTVAAAPRKQTPSRSRLAP